MSYLSLASNIIYLLGSLVLLPPAVLNYSGVTITVYILGIAGILLFIVGSITHIIADVLNIRSGPDISDIHIINNTLTALNKIVTEHATINN